MDRSTPYVVFFVCMSVVLLALLSCWDAVAPGLLGRPALLTVASRCTWPFGRYRKPRNDLDVALRPRSVSHGPGRPGCRIQLVTLVEA